MKALFISIIIFASPLLKAAEVHFDKKKIKLGNQTLTVEVANTSEQHARGLMYRKDLSPGTGMLFVFPDEETRNFWMKNTFVPLSIGYFNKKKELIDIQDMAPATSEMQSEFPTYVSKEPAQYALEVPKGWFSKNKVSLKMRFSFL